MDNTRKRIIVLLICLASIAICVLACFAVSRSYASEQASNADNTELTESATVEQTTAESSDDEIDSLEEYAQYLNGTSNEDYTSSSSYKTNNVNTTRENEAGEIDPDNTDPNIIVTDNEENAQSISVSNVDHFSRKPLAGNQLEMFVGSKSDAIATWTTPGSDVTTDTEYINKYSVTGNTITFDLEKTGKKYTIKQKKVPSGYIQQDAEQTATVESGKSVAVVIDSNPNSIGKAEITKTGSYDYPDTKSDPYSTGIYKIDNIYAFCSQPSNSPPVSKGDYANMDYYNVSVVGNSTVEKRITKTLYYSIHYPGYAGNDFYPSTINGKAMTDGYRWVCTHVLLGYLHSKYYDPTKDVAGNTAAVNDACYSCTDGLKTAFKDNILSKSNTNSFLYKILKADDVQTGFNAFFLYDTKDLGKQDMVFGTWTGGLKITKSSTNPTMSDFNTQNYSLKGAEFTITDVTTSSVVAVIYTNEDGVAEIDNLHTGTSTSRDFYVQETKAPPGYALNETYAQKVTVNIQRGTTGIVWKEISVTETPQYASVGVLLNKISEAGAGLPNGYFRVTEYAGQYGSEKDAKDAGATSKSWYLKTDSTGGAKLDTAHLADPTKYPSDAFFTDGTEKNNPCLPLGTVFVQEVEAPEGYVPDLTVKGPLNITSDSTKGKDPVVQTINNPDLFKITEHQLKISKQDFTTKAEISGAKLKIENSTGEEVASWTSDGNPHIVDSTTSPKLVPATGFKLIETEVPKGYVKADPITFKLNEDGTVTIEGSAEKVSSITMLDKKTELELSKIGITGAANELEGAQLELDYYNTKTEQYEKYDGWKSGTTSHKVTGAPVGNYKLIETTPPSCYTKAQQVNFTLKEDGKVEIGGEEVSKITMNDYLYISKQGVTGQGELPEATLQLLDSTGKQIDSWTSDTSAHIISSLAPGKYTIQETAAPACYALGSVEFEISVNGVITGTTTLKDKLSFSKKDIDGSTELDGATFELYKKGTTEPVETWTTSGQQPYLVENLDSGDYILHEASAPAGYTLADDIEFSLSVNGVVTSGVTTVYDSKTEIEIDKLDLVDGRQVIGAHLQLIKDGDVKADWTTGDKAHIEKGLPAGTYILHEVSAPAGYLIADDVEVEISDKGVSEKVVMKDDVTKLSIQKKDYQTKKALAGATFQLWSTKSATNENAQVTNNDTGNNTTSAVSTNSNDYVLDKIVDTWTSTEDPHVILRLPFGTYVLKEVNPPEGWLLGPDMVIDLNEETSQEPIEVEQCDDYTKLEIVKRDVSTGANLECAHLQLQDANGNVVADFITATTPYRIDHLNPGTYWLVEVDPPTGYQKADNVKVVVEETGEIQKAFMDDCKLPPNSGDNTSGLMALLVMLAACGCGVAYASTRLAKSRRK